MYWSLKTHTANATQREEKSVCSNTHIKQTLYSLFVLHRLWHINISQCLQFLWKKKKGKRENRNESDTITVMLIWHSTSQCEQLMVFQQATAGMCVGIRIIVSTNGVKIFLLKAAQSETEISFIHSVS